MTSVLLFGPKTIVNKNGYGGGEGGYTRNMRVYLQCFPGEDIQVTPCYHTVRGEISLGPASEVVRLIIDAWTVFKSLLTRKCSVVHVLVLGAGGAIFRDFAAVLLSKMFGKKVVYEIKAGEFATSYRKGGVIYKKLQRIIIRFSDVLLVEGRTYMDFLQREFKRGSYYFPNFVPDTEIPPYQAKDIRGGIHMLFVGYCYKGKGVFELMEAVASAFEKKVNLKLTIIGEEHPEFTAFADSMAEKYPGLPVKRLGRQEHRQVLENMKACNVYCYPTSHVGEGHNNSVNEAMMNSMVIITSNHGFLPDILGDGLAYHIDQVTPEDIDGMISKIIADPDTALVKARKSYTKLVNEFSSSSMVPLVRKVYRRLSES